MILLTDTNLTLQYTLVGICILGAIIWIMWKFFRKEKKTGCQGCSLAENCSRSDLKHRKNHNR